MGKAINRFGEKYGKLTIGEYIGSRQYGGRIRRFCTASCECGGTVEAPIDQIVKGSMPSCGCLRWRLGAANPKWTGCGEISGNYWDHVKRGALLRNFQMEITIEDAWEKFLQQDRKCAISGIPLSFDRLKGKTASLDRIDSKSGYIPGNIQWTHKDINRMKQHYDEDYFVSLCRAIVSHQDTKICQVNLS